MAADDLIQLELMLNRFRRLLGELARGEVTRNSFEPWEVEILVDIASYNLQRRQRGEVLRQYVKAVEKQMENGPGPPMTLSQYFQLKTTRRPTMRKVPPRTAPTASE